jgi:PAS domain S-box-containing protein
MLKDTSPLRASENSDLTPIDGNGSQPAGQTLTAVADGLHAVDAVLGAGAPQRVGRFRFFLDGHRWEWSDAVARMHGYEPGVVEPTTELLLRHQHPEDREQVAAVLHRVLQGEPFSSRHRIIDTAGQTHCLVVAGDSMVDDAGKVIGTSGFYVDVTEAIQSDISRVLSESTAARANIEQAKGVLMAAYGISAERAFDILVWRSQETNIKLRELADRFLTAIRGSTPPERLTYIDHALLTIE